MGTVLSNWRLPVDPAVDVLTRCRWFDYVELVLELDQPTYHLWKAPPDKAPRTLYFDKGYPLVFEALTGGHRGRFSSDHFDDTSDDPYFWAVYGARLVGWETQDFPLRYSLAGDLDAICDALSRLTDTELRENLAHAHDNPPPDLDEYQAPTISLEDRLKVFDKYLASRFLPALQQFYRAAREREEIVVYWMG